MVRWRIKADLSRCRSIYQNSASAEIPLSQVSPSTAISVIILTPQIPRRRNIRQIAVARIPHRRTPNMVHRPTRRHRQLHPHLPHVLCLHRLYCRPQTRHRHHLRSLHRPALLLLHRPRRMVERKAPTASYSQSVDSSDARECAPEMHLLVRVGQGSQG